MLCALTNRGLSSTPPPVAAEEVTDVAMADGQCFVAAARDDSSVVRRSLALRLQRSVAFVSTDVAEEAEVLITSCAGRAQPPTVSHGMSMPHAWDVPRTCEPSQAAVPCHPASTPPPISFGRGFRWVEQEPP